MAQVVPPSILRRKLGIPPSLFESKNVETPNITLKAVGHKNYKLMPYGMGVASIKTPEIRPIVVAAITASVGQHSELMGCTFLKKHW